VTPVDLFARSAVRPSPVDAPVLLQAEIVGSSVPAACTYMASSSRIEPSTNRSASRLTGVPFRLRWNGHHAHGPNSTLCGPPSPGDLKQDTIIYVFGGYSANILECPRNTLNPESRIATTPNGHPVLCTGLPQFLHGHLQNSPKTPAGEKNSRKIACARGGYNDQLPERFGASRAISARPANHHNRWRGITRHAHLAISQGMWHESLSSALRCSKRSYARSSSTSFGAPAAGIRQARAAQLNPFDLVWLSVVSNTVQNAIIGNDNSLSAG